MRTNVRWSVRLSVACLMVVCVGCKPEKPNASSTQPAGRSADPATATGADAGTQPDSRRQSIDDLVAAAEQALTRGDFDETRRNLRAALLIQPDSAEVLFLSAHVEASTGKLQRAIELLGGIDPNDPQMGVAALVQSAQWLTDAGKIDEAKSRYGQALALAPDDEYLRHVFAEFLNMVGWRYEAAQVLEPLVASGEATESELRTLINVSTSYITTQATRSGNAVTQEGPLSQAIGWQSARQPRKAIETLESMRGNGFLVNDPAVDAILAQAHAEIQEFDQLQSVLKKSSPEIRNFPAYWIAIGDQLRSDGKVKDAAGAYLQSLELDSTYELAHERLMGTLLQLGNKDAARAIDDRRALLISILHAAKAVGEGQPEDLIAGTDLAKHLEEAGHPIQAAAWLNHLLSRHPSHVTAVPLRQEIQRLLRIPESESLSRRYCGLSEKEFPMPDSVDRMIVSSIPSAEQSEPAKSRTQAKFVDVAAARGLRHTYQNAVPQRQRQFQIYQLAGAGIAAFDFDCDGNVDLFCGQGGKDPREPDQELSDALFRNIDGHFVPVTEPAGASDFGYTHGVTAGDINQDGFPDVLIGTLGFNRMLINQGDGTFVDASARVGWQEPVQHHNTTGLGIADISGDGLPDVVEVNYVNDPTMYEPGKIGPDGQLLTMPVPQGYIAEVDQTWISLGDGTFSVMPLGSTDDDSDQLLSAALGDAANPGLGLIISNFDESPGLEIFIANDSRPNQFWKRITDSVEGTSTTSFQDVATARGCAVSARGAPSASMGVAWADFDRNSMPDLIITNWTDEWLNLYLFDVSGMCRDLAPRFGLDKLSEGLLGFGCQPIDFDNDSFVDVIIANGHVEDMRHRNIAFKMSAQLLENLGDRFELATQADTDYWDRELLGRCAITCDYNRDGMIDVVISDLVDPLALLENQTETDNHWIQLQLVGVASERDAIGTRITVEQDGMRQSYVTATGDGYQGKNESVAAFGLAESDAKIDVTVHWPSGQTSAFENVKPNARYVLIEGASHTWSLSE